jgi:hypothetical protein
MPRKSKSKTVVEEVLEENSVSTAEPHDSQIVTPKIANPACPTSNPKPGIYEDRRKDMQRKLQKLVTSMRQDGKTEFEIKQALNKEKRKEERKIIELEEKRANEEKACSNDVIIVPVAWKRNHNEKVSVDVTCDNLRRALFSAGLKPWLDCRREYSPGQKFAYWEHMGVKFRIEIGPEDVSQGLCRVVRSDTPGAYLEHIREKPELNLQSVIRTLAKLGLAKCKEMNADLMSAESLIETPSFESNNPVDFTEEDDIGGNAVMEASRPQSQKKFRRF